MIRKLITISMLLLLNINYCFSQNDWEKGYIIKNQGDTVYGFIDNRDSRSNTKQCYFRKDEKEKTDIFGPNELIGYRYLDGKFYISKIIDGEEPGDTVFFGISNSGRG